MHLDIGADVVASDGHRVGKVERIIYDADTMMMREFVVHGGPFFKTGHIVHRELIDHIDDDHVVHLRKRADEVTQLAPFIAEQHFPAYRGDQGRAQTPYIMTQQGSVPRDAVVLTHRSQVYDRDGKHIGHLDEVVYEQDGRATAFVVDAGHFHVHDVNVPLSAIRSMRRDRIELNVAANEVDQAIRA